MYLTNTRPNICFDVNTLSQYMVEPRHVHSFATKHVMRYLKCTLDCGLSMQRTVSSNYMAMLIQTRQEVLKTKRALQDVVSVWDRV